MTMASKRRLRRVKQRRGCIGKTRHDTEKQAKRAVYHVRKSQQMKRAGRLEAYRCEFCGGWHIGNTKTRGSILRFIEQAAT